MAAERRLLELRFSSPLLEAPRTARVALPRDYDSSPHRHHPVLYLHDGQNVFTSADPGACFGWGDWGADRTADRLAVEGRAREVILVAIDNSPRRYAEYRGPAPGWRGGDDDSQTPHARYRRFLIEEVKPAIDRRFRTLTGPADTGILGSSMGGLCSLAIAWDHPEVFGLAGSLSGAFQVERSHFLRVVLGGHGGLPKPVRIYLDSGVVDHTGGDDGCANTRRVAAHLRRIGWRDGVDLLHFEDSPPLTTAQLRDTGLPESKWGEAQTSQHNEFYWRLRFGRALEFLFPAGPRA